MTQILITILLAIVSLYQNPKVQADPVMLAQVNTMFASIGPLAQEIAMTQATSTVTFNIPTSTDNSQPVVINIVPPVVTPPPQPTVQPVISQPVLGASLATSTPPIGSIVVLTGGASYQTYQTGQRATILIRVNDSTGKSTNGPLTVTTDDSTQDKVMQGTGLVDRRYCSDSSCDVRVCNMQNCYPMGAYAYDFEYIPKTDGQHIITFSAMGASQSVTITSTSSVQ